MIKVCGKRQIMRVNKEAKNLPTDFGSCLKTEEEIANLLTGPRQTCYPHQVQIWQHGQRLMRNDEVTQQEGLVAFITEESVEDKERALLDHRPGVAGRIKSSNRKKV